MHKIIKIHKFSVKFYFYGFRRISKILDAVIRIVFSCDLPATVLIGDKTYLYHNGLGCVFHPATVIGQECSIYQNVSIAGNGRSIEGRYAATIGNRVFIGAGAVILGPVEVGDGAMVGANAVVTHDVPPGTVVVGVPAKPVSS